MDDKLEFLNNTVGIYEIDSDTIRSIWIWEMIIYMLYKNFIQISYDIQN
jgi:hypothetical protein